MTYVSRGCYRLGAVSCRVYRNVRHGPSVAHAMVFGAAFGALLQTGNCTLLAVKALFFEDEAYALKSRERYKEKQLCFEHEIEGSRLNQLLIDYATEYNPAATRLPFQPFDPYSAGL
eukprot:TRINITY_DN66910_c0_g1_i1.p1 TRINITY_DN66910_c0_g1~~TRINITY_DN66910_c0_g1_i1.p1  ORF type:complete len:117 (-),score=12.05 TRINITY_DN66910_c0_g1_i1:112-462(-)